MSQSNSEDSLSDKLHRQLQAEEFQAKCARLLSAACAVKAVNDGYNSQALCNEANNNCHSILSYHPHEWQSDVMEAMMLGLDCLVCAGTLAGKTLPFVLLHLTKQG